ncbi:hypothetical protein LWC33_31845 [Pseudonocardia sp. RS11V-5]|uniref:SCO6745 family protein n=1 Tax=Pseudonocardia terrae TaxID=2905831 RepID=UPI001E5CE1D1|nr:hypothetical protein [Pseudonocardia terrae]MCE3556022.1 hypothetical protein [Pseudonocardia terrae]
MDTADGTDAESTDAAAAAVGAATTTSPARRLRDALEPVAMHAVWSPQVHEALAPHGYDFLTGYLTGLAAPLGEVPSALVTATFGVFEPGLVDRLRTAGRALLPLPDLIALRDRAAAASLRDTLGEAEEARAAEVATALEQAVDAVDGTARPLFSALRAQPRLADPFGRLWRAADLVREHRGDGHLAAVVATGLDPVRASILAELWVGYPVGEYSATRGWSEEVRAAAVAHLERDGLLTDGRLTAAGRELRDGVEAATDASQEDLVAALPDLDALVSDLRRWSARCIEAGTFPDDDRKRAAG